MAYHELLEKSDERFLKPLVWQMPGTTLQGKTRMHNGAALALGEEVRKLTDEKVLLVMGRHVREQETGRVICQALSEAGVEFDIFSELYPEPHFDVAVHISVHMNENHYGAVIGAGGGSSLDMAKLAAHGADGRLIEKIMTNDFSNARLPLILLPTTSGTGSEVSPYTVLTVEGTKKFYTSAAFLPDVAIVDPLLTVTMPPRTTAATAFDAMTHALEGSMASQNPYTECLATESTALILTYLKRVLADGEDIEARYYLSLASVMGMLSYVMGGGLYAHSISYILTLEKDTPHGLGCGLALPYTLAMNESQIHSLLDNLSARCFGHSGSEELRRRVIAKIQQLFVETGLPESLSDLGYTVSDIPNLADTLLNRYYRQKNPRSISRDEATRLLQAMILGEIEYF
ncbi:iron-containing alcohol dehydrogenase [Roseburia hominis]